MLFPVKQYLKKTRLFKAICIWHQLFTKAMIIDLSLGLTELPVKNGNTDDVES